MKVPDRAIGHRMPMSVHIKSCFKKLTSMLLVLDDCQASFQGLKHLKRRAWQEKGHHGGWTYLSRWLDRQLSILKLSTLDDRTSLAGPAMMGGSAEQVLIAPLSGQN